MCALSLVRTERLTDGRTQVDAHFHRSFGHDEVYELHGNVELWQCAGLGTRQPCDAVWRAAPDARFAVDTKSMTASGGDIAVCAHCGGRARPNVLMFRDTKWIQNAADEVRHSKSDSLALALALSLLLVYCVVAESLRRVGSRDGAGTASAEIRRVSLSCSHLALALRQMLQDDPSLRLVVLEIGCGMRVRPSLSFFSRRSLPH